MSDVSALRLQEFPWTAERAFLNHGSYGPLPRRGLDAAHAALEAQGRGELGDPLARTIAAAGATRAAVASLLGCVPADIAFFKGTSEALALVAAGLSWSEGDEIVIWRHEHPNGAYPWTNLRGRGVVVRYFEGTGLDYTSANVLEQITDRTRVIALSLVDYRHGAPAPIEEISAVCRERGIWLVVDAIHSLGVLRTDVPAIGADIVAAHAYKYLLGGLGIGVAFCSTRARAELRVPAPGWMGRRDLRASDASMHDFDFDPSSDARRFESSVPSLAALAALEQSVGLILETGIGRIEDHVLALAARLRAELADRGYEVMRPRGRTTSIVTARRADLDPASLRMELDAARVTISGALADGLVRVTPHFYNDESDIERLLACLPK